MPSTTARLTNEPSTAPTNDDGVSDAQEDVQTPPGFAKRLCALLDYAGTIAGLLSAVILSGPVWAIIYLAGPHMPNLYIPTACAAGLRLFLDLCYLGRGALADGQLTRWEVVGVSARWLCDVLVTAHALFPQPFFITIVGGPFSGGDAARAGHMRASRWLWRQSVDMSAELVLILAVIIYLLGKRMRRGDLSSTPAWLRGLLKALAFGVGWTVLAARMQLLPIRHILGGWDMSSSLAFFVPDGMLMGRKEFSLFHNFTASFPSVTACMIVIGDILMSNPAMPGPVGAAGALFVGIGLRHADQPTENGYWLACAAWIASAITSVIFGEDEAFELPSELSVLGGMATVELEEEEDDATGPTTSSAQLVLPVPALPETFTSYLEIKVKKVGMTLRSALPAPAVSFLERETCLLPEEWKFPWPEAISLDAPVITLCTLLAVVAFASAPLATVAWGVWGLAWWMWLGSTAKCSLEWLPNEG